MPNGSRKEARAYLLRLPRMAFAGFGIALAALLLLAGTAGAATLITASEAALPADTAAGRGVSRGPRVTIVSPPPTGGLVRSPVNLRLHFESFGGAKINAESVVITYKKVPPIDLTQRVTAFFPRYLHAKG